MIQWQQGSGFMAKRTKATQIIELTEEIERYKSYLHDLHVQIDDLVNAEENTFLHSPTYLQMQKEIDFLKNLEKLNQRHLASTKATLHKWDEGYQQVYEDNKKFVKNYSNMEYFIGITNNWREAKEYQKLKDEICILTGKLEQKEISLSDREKEISNLQKEISLLQLSLKSASNSTNKVSVGRKKNSESEKHQRDIQIFRELIESNKSINEIMEEMEISRATYFRYKKEIEK